MKSLRYIDFYAGLGGWTMALRSACKSLTSSTSPIATPIELECVASFDHSDLCRDVYHANFGGTKKATRIERLECSHVENADVWMSLGDSYRDTDRKGDAVAAYKKYLELAKPDDFMRPVAERFIELLSG